LPFKGAYRLAGRSIKVFLIEGTASGLRTAELGLSTTKAIVVPRASLSAVSKRSEMQKTGVYVLVGGDSDRPGFKKIYVGEGDTILPRLISHNSDEAKDFWSDAVVFVSKDENLTKAHARYLEARLIALAKEAKRATVANGTEPPSDGKLPEADGVEMEEFISQVRLLLGTLGYDILEPLLSPPPQVGTAAPPEAMLPEFRYEGDGFAARCVIDLDAGQFVVKAGSTARIHEGNSLSPTYRNLRAQLRDAGVLIPDGGVFKFSQDYAFTAATPAAQVVSGQTVNGRVAWRANDTTFAQWEDKRLRQIERP
jgi:hypothetical protein